MGEAELRQELMGFAGTETYQKNYLVEAGAGAGKTYTMVQRIINQLLSAQIEPENLAAITFTVKAAQQMRDRLDSALQEAHKKALAAGKQEAASRLSDLIERADTIQISTIHALCQKLLELMPFCHRLGTGFRVYTDDRSIGAAYFRRRYFSDETLFTLARDRFGLDYEAFLNTFLSCTENQGAVLCYEKDPSKLQAWEKDLAAAAGKVAGQLQAELAKQDGAELLLGDTLTKLLQAQTMTPQCTDAVSAWVLARNKKLPLKSSAPEGVKLRMEALLQGPEAEETLRLARLLSHSYTLSVIDRLLQDFREDKLENQQASFSDLLCCARDMLRDSTQARAYFHSRYRCIYVDEYQDTDPVQAELLFFLTAEPSTFCASDWTKCRPVPGSLFLVGDPKQAIYRFRGADIGTYARVKQCFAENGDEVVKLQYNFRSVPAITELSDKVFANLLTGGAYQADFSSMLPQQQTTPLAGGYVYPANGSKQKACKEADPGQIASFIADMVSKGAAHYRDFLILTYTTKPIAAYAWALEQRGIPVNADTQEAYSEVPAICRAVCLLQFLLAPQDDLKLLEALEFCFAVPYPALRRLLVRSGVTSLHALLRADSLDAICSALAAEQPQDAELLDLCGVLQSLCRLQKKSRRMDAMSFFRYLFDGARGVWAEEPYAVRRRSYARVQQFLMALEEKQEGGFSAMARAAIDLSQEKAGRVLPLDAQLDCVRIMNLHKAKGLEGRIVILAFDSRNDFQPSRYIDLTATPAVAYETVCKTVFGRPSILAEPEQWQQPLAGGKTPEQEEQAYQQAEALRLLYVAQTRAKELLIVCGKVVSPIYNKDGKLSKRVKTEGVETAWQLIADCCEKTPPEGSLLSAFWPSLCHGTPFQAPTTAAATVSVDPDALETALAQSVSKAARSDFLEITPSRLDHGSRLAAGRKDPAEESAPSTENTESVQELPFSHTAPCGNIWGTIVHRIFELAVRTGDFTSQAQEAFAKQAVEEELTGVVLTKAQKAMLFGQSVPETEQAAIAQIAAAAIKATAFLCDSSSPLRRFMAGKSCYPELPFALCEKPGSALYTHLQKNMHEVDDGILLDVQGIIDLAILGADGWTVVDYKTDIPHPGESGEALRQRLRAEYGAQINAYAMVLGGLGRGGVKKKYLCSVALGGELIEL